MAADADSVEACFRERVLTLEEGPAVAEGQMDSARDDGVGLSGGQAFIETMDASAAAPIILPQEPVGRRRRRVAAKAIRLRDKEHCRYLTTQPCVVCGRTPSEAHHIRFAEPRALGRKVTDEYTVPVCRLHHRDLHGYGDEASWWAAVSIDPLPIALDRAVAAIALDHVTCNGIGTSSAHTLINGGSAAKRAPRVASWMR